MNGNGVTRTWLMAGLMMALVLPGCGGGRSLAPMAAPAAVTAQTTVTPLKAAPSLVGLAITDAVVTCSEIVHDERPVGFHLSGHLPSGEIVTVFYNGREPVAPGTADVDVPDDTMINRLRALRGQYELQMGPAGRLPEGRSFSATERKAVLTAVQRTLKASPVGRNPLGQSVKVVLNFIDRTLRDAKSGQE